MDKKEESMKTWDATKAKFYSEIMGWCAYFLGLSEEATESEVHEATSKITDTLSGIREAAIKAAQDTVAAQMKELSDKVEANTQSITEVNDKLKAKETEAETLSGRVGELEESLKGKDKEISELKATHEKEKNTLASEISKLKAGRSLETDENTETVSHQLGNGGGGKAGTVIQNNEMKAWLKKPVSN